jgi:flagellar hook assembly protein FlgD
VTISVYDVTGALVRTLVDTHRAPGRYTAQWNGVDNRGNTVGSGVYFYRMTAAGYQSQTRQMVLLK